jgi:hypothetical protein
VSVRRIRSTSHERARDVSAPEVARLLVESGDTARKAEARKFGSSVKMEKAEAITASRERRKRRVELLKGNYVLRYSY